jgi:crotonobetainyl-CoA:carnitine CoA-transferase CaiB-like acyl-CoA transferase
VEHQASHQVTQFPRHDRKANASVNDCGPVPSARLLEGLRVIEFCQIAAGPFCGMLLADFGASVTKIEPPGGDALRQWPPFRNDFSENFASLNRGKRSIVLDLKNQEDRDLARSLVLDADVLIENNRPGAMERLGLGHKWFHECKPNLVYCSISAFGQTGPRATQGGFDVTIQAAAGVMSVTGEPGGAPIKAGVPISDFAAGLYGAFSIAAAVANVRNGARGVHIDVPMFATTLAIAALQTSEYFGTGKDPRKFGSAHPRNAPYQAYEAADGWLVIAAGNDRLWRSVCAVLERQDLIDEPRFASTVLRARNQSALAALITAALAATTVSEWIARFDAVGVPCSPINSYSQALQDPQSTHLDLVRPMALPNGERSHTVGCPIRIDGATIAVDTSPPGLGEYVGVNAGKEIV